MSWKVSDAILAGRDFMDFSDVIQIYFAWTGKNIPKRGKVKFKLFQED
jgi:hypothetical protein